MGVSWLQARVAVLLLLGFCKVGAQDTLHCNCEGPYNCNPANNSCVARKADDKPEIACLIYKEFRNTGETAEVSLCLAVDRTYYLLKCEPGRQVWPERRGGIPWKTVVTYCCTSDYCNTKEALQELIDGMDPSDLPPNFVTSETTPSDGVATADGTVSAPPFTIPSSSSSEQPATSTASSSSSSSSSSDTPVYAMVVIAVLSLTVVIIVAVIVVILTLHFLPQRFSQSVKGSGSSIVSVSFPVDSSSYSDPSLNELLEDSGSGSGLPLLIQRSISGQITLHNLIGKGRFGEVWRGIYKGDQVAVKIFHTREELSWFHEVEVYQTCLLRHPNVLRFIAADNRDVGLQMQLWLISDYCELGSLFDLLSRETFSQATALKLCHTAASGINHLHTEIVGAQCKPAIAHRDLKSRNILVKSDYSCCIADLGLSLTYKQATGVVKTPPRTTVGTRRYLAPEVLTESITIKNFESFKRSDIYSFGLVMWEIGRRAECDGHAEEAQLPYFDLIPSDPTLEEVQRVVVQERRRPSLPNPWNQHEVMAGLSRIIQQCWLHEAQARLTSLRIKKSLANLREFFRDTKEPGQP